MILAVGALAAAVVAFLVLRAAPRATVALWLVVLFFMPVWVGVSIGPFWAAITLMTMLAVATCSRSIELSPADGVMAAFALLIVAQFVLGLTTMSGMMIALTEWVLPYVWGRLVLTRVSLDVLVRLIAVVAFAAAALALIESATSTNLFVLIPPGASDLYQTWATLQPRGGLIRAEGAFGHSIALGAVLSMCAAFVLAAPWRLVTRLLILLALAAAVVMTLSRIGLVTFVVTVALSVLVLPGLSARTRVLTALGGLIGALVVVPFLSDVFLEADQEAAGSAGYRLDLLALGGILRPFGAAPNVAGLTVDGEYLGDFARSVDNALLVVAMRVGWVPALLLIAVLVISVARIVRRQGAHPASVAVTGQFPGLIAVAFITQYSTFFWFSVGLAVALDVISRRLADDEGRLAAPVQTFRPSPLREDHYQGGRK